VPPATSTPAATSTPVEPISPAEPTATTTPASGGGLGGICGAALAPGALLVGTMLLCGRKRQTNR
jgi:hypothetical protein